MSLLNDLVNRYASKGTVKRIWKSEDGSTITVPSVEPTIDAMLDAAEHGQLRVKVPTTGSASTVDEVTLSTDAVALTLKGEHASEFVYELFLGELPSALPSVKANVSKAKASRKRRAKITKEGKSASENRANAGLPEPSSNGTNAGK